MNWDETKFRRKSIFMIVMNNAKTTIMDKRFINSKSSKNLKYKARLLRQ